LGCTPRLLPLTGEPRVIALPTTPDAGAGIRALRAEGYPGWQQQVAARSVLRIGF
jgi:hypothetical protein